MQQGWTDALRTLHADERVYTSATISASSGDAGLRIAHLLLNAAVKLRGGGVDR